MLLPLALGIGILGAPLMTSPAVVSDQPSITCKLGALSPEKRARHGVLVRQLTRELPTASKELDYGFEFQYRHDAETLAKLTEWIGYESQCCEFFTFEIAVAPQNGPIRLRWYGSEAAAKAIIKAAVGELAAR
jgi:hypothetical protein